jgi:hypothetical protein
MLKIEQVNLLFFFFSYSIDYFIVKGRGTVPSVPKSASTQSDSRETIEELEMRLSLKNEENDALKNALKSMLDAKEEDLKLYNETIQSVKDIFLQGIQHYKPLQTTTGSS